MPAVSIMMPMRNAADYVEQALRSVLAETRIDLEVIVVDDGSTDGSAEVVAGLGDSRVRIIRGPGTGVSGAFNAGVDACRGELFMRCDADDEFVAGRIRWQVEWMAEHPEFVAVCGAFSTMDRQGRPVSDLECGDTAEEITEEMRRGVTRTSLCTFAVRTQSLRDLGGCRDWFITSSDLDMQLRLATVGRVWYEPRPCYRYRLHDSSITHSQVTVKRQFFEESARLFARQRTADGVDDLEHGTPPPVPEESNGDRGKADDHVFRLLTGRAWQEHREGRRMRALATGLRACALRPRRVSAWRSLAALCIRRPSGEPKPG